MRVKILVSAALIALASCGNRPSEGPAGQSETQALRAAADDPRLQRFYEARGWRPAWDGEAGQRLTEAIGGATRHGLEAAAFLGEIPEGGDAAVREAALSRAALAYAEALARGRTDPTRFDHPYTLPRPNPDLAAGLAQAIEGGNVAAWLDGLAPQDAEYRTLSDAYVQANRQIADSGGNPPPQLVDRARTLAVNLERRRWLERAPAATRIDVNTGAAMLTYIRDNAVADRRRVVVGEPGNETPELASPLYRLVANPTWTVPRSIQEEEIAPRGDSYLARNNMEWRDGWIVQRPGPANSLGLVKFDMQNDHAIYLHDTPAKALFAEADRHRSHGCVRVQDALGFAQMLAGEQNVLDQWNEARAERDEDGDLEETMVALARPIPVRLLYHTAFLADGRLTIVPDHYGWDEAVAVALGLPPRPRSPVRHVNGDVGP
ncbi:MAG: L,D-transpeptidase family protein [Sphingosinicella sp.]|uniref:L,D-transpeptidase family protein n=1 Tax=Sphingosinicella sp. TaxID=1917971 RepID=UPI004037CD6C